MKPHCPHACFPVHSLLRLIAPCLLAAMPSPAAPEAREDPTTGALAGWWKVSYEDSVLGTVSGAAEFDADPNSGLPVRVTYRHPLTGKEYDLRASRGGVRQDGKRITIALEGESPPSQRILPPSDQNLLILRHRKGDPLIARSKGINRDAPVGTRGDVDWNRVELHLTLQNRTSLDGTWEYRAHPTTERDHVGYGRVGTFTPDGESCRAGTQKGEEHWVRTPQIEGVIVLTKPLPYPFPRWTGAGPKNRTLFVFGKNLPMEQDARLEFVSSDLGIRYARYPVHGSTLNEQLLEMYEMPKMRAGYNPTAEQRTTEPKALALAKEKSKETDAMVFYAEFEDGILAGPKTLLLNGAPASWALEFLDLGANARFVRETIADQYELARSAYSPGELFLEVETEFRVPIDKIPVVVGVGPKNACTLLASRLGNGETYRTPALKILSPGTGSSGSSIVAKPGDTITAAESETSVMSLKQPHPVIPVIGDIRVVIRPRQGRWQSDESIPSVTGDQPFFVEVRMPQEQAKALGGKTLDVAFQNKRTGSGGTLTLSSDYSPWDNPVVFTTADPLTVAGGGIGEGGYVTLWGGKIFRGDMSGLRFHNADTIKVSYAEASAEFQVYDTWVQQRLAHNVRFLQELSRAYSRCLGAPNLSEHDKDALHLKLRLVANAMRVMDSFPDDPHKLYVSDGYIDMLQGGGSGYAYKGSLSGEPDPAFGAIWTSNEERQAVYTAKKIGDEHLGDLFHRLKVDTAIACYRAFTETIGADSLVMVVFGINNMGEKVGLSDRFFGFLDFIDRAGIGMKLGMRKGANRLDKITGAKRIGPVMLVDESMDTALRVRAPDEKLVASTGDRTPDLEDARPSRGARNTPEPSTHTPADQTPKTTPPKHTPEPDHPGPRDQGPMTKTTAPEPAPTVREPPPRAPQADRPHAGRRPDGFHTQPIPDPTEPGLPGRRTAELAEWTNDVDRRYYIDPEGQIAARGQTIDAGGFATVHATPGPDGSPSRVTKFYERRLGERREAQAMVRDTRCGADALKEAGVRQIEIDVCQTDAAIPYVRQRRVGHDLPEGVRQEVTYHEACQVVPDADGAKRFIVKGPYQEGVLDVYEDMIRGDVVGEDIRIPNLAWQLIDDAAAPGGQRWTAAILDQDRIAYMADGTPIAKTDRGVTRHFELERAKRAFEEAPHLHGIASAAEGGMKIQDAREFMFRMLERHKFIQFDEVSGTYKSGALDIGRVRKRFERLGVNIDDYITARPRPTSYMSPLRSGLAVRPALPLRPRAEGAPPRHAKPGVALAA